MAVFVFKGESRRRRGESRVGSTARRRVLFGLRAARSVECRSA